MDITQAYRTIFKNVSVTIGSYMGAVTSHTVNQGEYGRILHFSLCDYAPKQVKRTSATINRYPLLQLLGLIQLTQILKMFVKAIFDEPTERSNWPSSQRNLNVNEDVFGTQVEQQLQDSTVCSLCFML